MKRTQTIVYLIDFISSEYKDIESLKLACNTNTNLKIYLCLDEQDFLSYAKKLKPSARGELEITDLNNLYLQDDKLSVEILDRGFTWLDTGTFDSLLQAANYIASQETNSGEKIACLEEIAINEGFISKDAVLSKINKNIHNEYVEYINLL